MKPMTLIIEHTLDTLDGLSIKRRIELLEALHAIAISAKERAGLRAQICALADAERHNFQLKLDLRARSNA